MPDPFPSLFSFPYQWQCEGVAAWKIAIINLQVCIFVHLATKKVHTIESHQQFENNRWKPGIETVESLGRCR